MKATALALVLSLSLLALATEGLRGGQEGVQQYLREAVKIFDFEFAQKLGRQSPLYWKKVGGRGLPAYTKGQFDDKVYYKGRTSFCFQMNGGDCLYEYHPKRIPINTAYDYCLEGWIRAEGLKHSKAYLGIWFNDQQGRQIPGTKVLTNSVTGQTGWTRVEAHISSLGRLPGQPPARFADISMEVRGLEAQDIGAKVWFDHLTVYRIPRLRMQIADKQMLFEVGKKVVVQLRADGLLAGSFPGRLVVRDDRGVTIMDRVASLVPGPQGEGYREVELADLPPGAYHMTYDMPGDKPTVLCRRASFAVMAPRQNPPHLVGGGFGLADPTGIEDPKRLADVVTYLGVHALKLPLWRSDTTAEQLKRGSLLVEQAINMLRHRKVECIGVFSEAPQYLVKEITDPVRGMADLLSMEESRWEKAIGLTVSRYGGMLASWQLGGDDDPSTIRLQVEPGLLEAVTLRMDRLTAGRPLGMPWPASYALPSKMPPRVDYVSLKVGTEVAPGQIQEYIAGIQSADGLRLYLTLEPITRSHHSQDDRIFDFVSRVLAAKQAGIEEIFFHKLVDPERGLMRSANEPAEMLLVARTLTDMLGSTRFAGHLPLEHEASAMVFERPDGSETIVIWKEDLRFPIKTPLYLGEQLAQTDLLGNRTLLPRFGSVTSLTLQPMPVFITGIDPQISRTRRSFRLVGGAIQSAYRRHKVEVEFVNGFSRSISGLARLKVPKNWKVDPLIIKFRLGEGERKVQPLTVIVPYNETVGKKEIRADFTVESKATYRFVAVAPLRFEMVTARMSAVAFQEGPNIVIEQEITCTARQPTSFSAYAQIPGRTMMSHFISKVAPGDSVVRRYVLPYSPMLEHKNALVGVRDDSPDRGFANLLLPLGGVHARGVAHRASSDSPTATKFPRGM